MATLTPAPDVFFAARSNTAAIDRDAKGGNPFATALIELLSRPRCLLAEVPDQLQRLTSAHSKGRQQTEVPEFVAAPDWPLVPRPENESRLALVMVVSDYSASPSLKSLAGAAFDAERLAVAFGRAGFVTQKVLDPSAEKMRRELAEFEEASSIFDVAAIYVTGHGVEFDRETFLLPGDFLAAGGDPRDYRRRAISLRTISRAPKGRQVNLVFFGGCRTA